MASKRAASTEPDKPQVAKRTQMATPADASIQTLSSIQDPGVPAGSSRATVASSSTLAMAATTTSSPPHPQQSRPPTQQAPASSPQVPHPERPLPSASNSQVPNPTASDTSVLRPLVSLPPISDLLVASIPSVSGPPVTQLPASYPSAPWPPALAPPMSGPPVAQPPASYSSAPWPPALAPPVPGPVYCAPVACPLAPDVSALVGEAISVLTPEQIRESVFHFAMQNQIFQRSLLENYCAKRNQRHQGQTQVNFDRVVLDVKRKLSDYNVTSKYSAVKGNSSFIASSIETIVQKVRSEQRVQSWPATFPLRVSAIANLRRIGTMIAGLDGETGKEVRKDFLMEGNPLSKGLLYLARNFSLTERTHLLKSHAKRDKSTFEERMEELIELCEMQHIAIPDLRKSLKILRGYNRAPVESDYDDNEELESGSEDQTPSEDEDEESD
ncbi:hypothetical protein HDK90DRAFT_311820 [Phyllosticta capitalensis]|uniref:Uncharacterized protein n=1 Tax=Phyllosticta capitalensis TaxID=121624 RepID=A0ABR1YL09_9PEZI